MSSVHCIVVWEYQERGEWLPHTPSVTRTLERAHAKKLTRVVLADADPALKGHYVNLRTLTQSRDTPDGGSVECLVRRWCYSVTSVGGRGARWEWARLTAPPLPADLEYRPMSMEMQCAVEEAWSSGIEVVLHNGWTIQPSRGAARRGGAVRLVRRSPQPPYPLTRSEAPPLPTRNLQQTIGHRPRIPQQHTGSSVQSTRSAPPTAAACHALPGVAPGATTAPPPHRPGARSASPRERKPGLARQILHNLNIFSTTMKPPPPSPRARSPSSRTEEGSNRRHSVDTVSTYLSHESKDSLQQGSVELLNCSGGSDDVFEATQPIVDITTDSPEEDDDDDEMYLGGLCRVVSRAGPPQWGAVCPVCVQPLAGRATRALNRCRHMLHRDCLRDAARRIQGPLQIQCLVCGETYREEDGPSVASQRHGGGGGAAGTVAPLAVVTSRDVARQPPGSMAWRLQHVALPNTDCDTSILVTYNFQSGVQGVDDPVPGAPYYAVGFPRHSVLPDTVEGRQVLSLLRVAWERGVLFCVSASRTTGREHVVSWRVPPPPAPRDYTPQRLQRARDCLHGLLAQHS